MHPVILYELARTRIDDDLREAERRRLLREAANGRGQRPSTPTMFDRVRSLLFTVAPRPVRAGA